MEWLADHASHPGAKTSLAKMIVKPGAETPLHRHDNCSEVIHVLEGAVELQVSAKAPIPLGAGETHLFPAYTPHSSSDVPPARITPLVIKEASMGMASAYKLTKNKTPLGLAHATKAPMRKPDQKSRRL
jgi:quercetin dioxygenase-like cupin family protein